MEWIQCFAHQFAKALRRPSEIKRVSFDHYRMDTIHSGKYADIAGCISPAITRAIEHNKKKQLIERLAPTKVEKPIKVDFLLKYPKSNFYKNNRSTNYRKTNNNRNYNNYNGRRTANTNQAKSAVSSSSTVAP